MIKEHRKLALQDLSGRGNDVNCEVNWNKSGLVDNCKLIRVTIGDGYDRREAIISKEHLFTMLMLMGDDKEQERLVAADVEYTPMRDYSTVVTIKTRNDVKKGEEISIPMTVSQNKLTGQLSIKP